MVTERRNIANSTANINANNVGQNAVQSTKEYRNILDAFNELKQARSQFEIENMTKMQKHHKTKKKSYDVYYTGSIKNKNKKAKAINQDKLSIKEWFKYRINKLRYDKKEIKKLAFVTAGVFALCIGIISTNYIFAESRKEEFKK